MFGLGFQGIGGRPGDCAAFLRGNKLPEVGSALGKAIREFKHATAESDPLEPKAGASGLQPRHPRRTKIGSAPLVYALLPSTPHLDGPPPYVVPHMPHAVCHPTSSMQQTLCTILAR